jgi:CRISPR-associated Cas5-like protein
MRITYNKRYGLMVIDAPLPAQAVAVAFRAAPAWIVAAGLLMLASSAWAGEGGSKHDFRDTREALIRQMSPEGRYCVECHRYRKPSRSFDVRLVAQVPLPSTALLFGTALGGLVIAKKWRKA